MRPSYPDYLLLLQAVLTRAEQFDFTARAHLQLGVSLVYRLMSLDPKQVEPYLALAFLFCVIDEWKRAQQILMYANRLMPQEKAVQQFLYKLQTRDQMVETEDLSPVELTLPDYQSIKSRLGSLSHEDLSANFSQIRPLLSTLGDRLFREPSDDK